MFLPCHPYKVNRGGDNRDDPRRILEDSVDCVWIGREGTRVQHKLSVTVVVVGLVV